MERFWKTAVDSTEMSVGGVRERGRGKEKEKSEEKEGGGEVE